MFAGLLNEHDFMKILQNLQKYFWEHLKTSAIEYNEKPR